MNGPGPILTVRGLTKSYRMAGRTLTVLEDVDLDLAEGEMLAIVGPSGSGKSTLLHQVGLLDRPDAGEVRYRGDPLPLGGTRAALARNRHFGFVFQFYHLLPEFDAVDNVLMPAMILQDAGSWRRRKRELRGRARALLERFGLGERMHHKPPQLSGGERQRVAIARGLMNAPPVLLCDEPTGNLDRKTADDVRRLLRELNRADRQSMIVVTHDRDFAREADRTLELVDGRLGTS